MRGFYRAAGLNGADARSSFAKKGGTRRWQDLNYGDRSEGARMQAPASDLLAGRSAVSSPACP
jgi:hypothetical protein